VAADCDRDRAFMEQAARVAQEGVQSGRGGPFGALIIHQEKVVAAACNRVIEKSDPTAHAEIEAIREACRKLGRFHLKGCVLYTTCEPCPMCQAAIHWARLEKVYYSRTRADAEALGFADARIAENMQAAASAIEMERIDCAAAQEAFELWRNRENRVDY